MNKDQAKRLVSDTFTNSFEKERFRRFIKELLNRYDETKAGNWNLQYIKDAFKPHVHRYERLGTYTTPDDEEIDILIVYLTQDSKLERARTALRDFVAYHLKTRDQKDSSLVAFVSPSEEAWRFSFVKMEYEAKLNEKGKVSVSQNLTPARRYSYLVGAHEQCHTAQTRFLGLLQNTTDAPALSAIEDAFSVEAVTKEFFQEYARLFSETEKALSKSVEEDRKIQADFAIKGVSAVDLAKKLLGQIVFLYFIQKKGWLGVPRGKQWGDGPRDFMRGIAARAVRENQRLFDDVLEPLFYDTLATDRGHEAWCDTFESRIPFLNGGLFEPLAGYAWQETEINLPNSLFTNTTTTGDDIGTGILDVFDRYNFTVNESEPLEKEVAIDPEMLGKVFENLIEENRRKGLGAYYTPREIVHYMCQESLINYLDTKVNEISPIIRREEIAALIREGEQAAHYEAARKDGTISYERRLPEAVEKNARPLDEALKAITVCDPAIGSGAFPVGMMTEIVRARVTLTPYFNDITERTPYYFKRHAIQNSLYGVDVDAGAVEIAKLRLWLSLVVDEDDVKHIKPLPNLDYKIVAGNSLLGVTQTLFNDEHFRQLETLKPKYFNESDRVKKSDFKRQIDDMIYTLTNGRKVFDFQIYLSEVFHANGGFDIVIANPPYLKERDNKHVFSEVNDSPFGRKYHQGKMDYWFYFLHLSIDIVKANGAICFITSRYWLNSYGAKKLIKRVRENLSFRDVVDIGKLKVFDNVAGHHMVHLYQKDRSVENFRYRLIVNDVQCIRETAPSDNVQTHLLSNMKVFSANDEIIFAKNPIHFKNCVLLDLITETSIGVQESVDKISNKQVEKSGRRDVLPGSGVFVLSEKELNSLRLTAIEKECVKSYLDPNSVLQYRIRTDTRQHLIYTDAITRALISDDHRYINLKRHLDFYADFITSSNAPYGLHRCRSMRFFERPKIIFKNMFVSPEFTYDEHGYYVGFSFSLIIQRDNDYDLKYILGILNSTLAMYWFTVNGKHRGAGLDIGVEKLRLFPVKKATAAQQKPIIEMVERLLSDPEYDGSPVQIRRIDRLVYDLYGLTSAEVALIEEAVE